MDSDRFDAIVRSLGRAGSRRRLVAGLLTTFVVSLRPVVISAQEEFSASDADGTNSTAAIDSGSSTNSTSIGIDTDGGTSISGTSGGSGNLACNCSPIPCRAFLGCDDQGHCLYEKPFSCPIGFEVNLETCDSCVPVPCPNAGRCPGASNDCDTDGYNCACWPTTEGGSICGQNTLCIFAPPCVTSADCASGEACVATCCDELICVLPCGQFRPDAVQSTGSDGRTATGR